MRKFLNTLYITTPDVYLSLDGENVVVRKDDKETGRVPLHNIEAILCFNYTGASPALMNSCAKNGIELSFFKPNGRFLSRIQGEVTGNVLLRKKQYKTSDEPECLPIAKNIIVGKLHNSRYVLEKAARENPMRLDAHKLKEKSLLIKEAITEAKLCESLEVLRGFEGMSAKAYFSVFDELIINQKEDFFFHTRSKRPPMDNTNAMLSFMYSIFTSEISSALEGVGLDPYVGFMHRDRPGRSSLALDLLEELRAVLIDRFVIALINRREVDKDGFIKEENGSVTMRDDTRVVLLKAWQKRKQEELTHPFTKEKVQWGLVPHIQASLLARFLRGDIDGYPPFLWK